MKILGIETSCDETAMAVIESTDQNHISVLANIIHSQIDLHKNYGGVFPSLAKREHAQNAVPVLLETLEKANLIEHNENPTSLPQDFLKNYFAFEPELVLTFQKLSEIKKPDLDLIAVTEGPGLEPALWVGINFARALSELWQIPLIAINHMEGHIMSVLNADTQIETPAIALLISGGHTELVLVKNLGDYQILGQTKDDAVGEAFDKTARLLGLEYPGGPKISKLANEARTLNLDKFAHNKNTGEKIEIKLPRPMIDSPNFDFSFSGLKTAVLYLVRKLETKNLFNDTTKKMVAREFEDAVIEVLVKKTEKALQKFSLNNLIVGGGVIANKNIREALQKLNVQIYFPDNSAITDNGLMIAIAGLYKNDRHPATINPPITARGNLRLG